MDERARIEQVIRAALDAGLDTGVGGVVAELVEIANATNVQYLRDEKTDVDVRHLEVVRVDGDIPTANLDATLSITATRGSSAEVPAAS